MNSRTIILLVAVAAVVIVGATYLFTGSDASTLVQPSPHAIDQNP